jgi:hypothetical protein
MYIRVISFILALGVFITPVTNYAQEEESVPDETCVQLVDWLYKDLTLQNLDKSFERTKNKLFMGMLKTLENVQGVNLKNHPELLKLWKSLSEVDPEFENYLNNNYPYRRYRFWRNKSYNNIKTYSFLDAIEAWKKLQDTKPEYFKGMEDKFKLDKWDLVTADVIDNVSDIKYKNGDIKSKLQELSSKIKEAGSNPTKKLTQELNLNELKQQVDDIQKDIYKKSSDLYVGYINDYGHVCNPEVMSKADPLHLEEYLCLARNDEVKPDIAPLLVNLANVITLSDLNMAEQPEVPPLPPEPDEVDKLKIEKIDYKVNSNKNATYCLRDPNVVDTLVIHHTGSSIDFGPEDINEAHIGRSTMGDPWYMVGYNYLVSEKYNGGSFESPSIIQGRPPEMRGAHAGGYTRELSKERKKELSQYEIKCGRDDNFVTANMSSEFVGGQISGNITGLGIAILGNYETKYTAHVGGVTLHKNVKGNSKITFPSEAVLNKVAQLACKLQRQYPNIKRMVPHSYFKATNCPGSVIARLQTITNMANSYGCNFNDPEYVK